MSTMAGFTSVLPTAQRLPRNPMLSQHPLGAFTDSQYEAAIAQLRYDIQRQYNDIIQQLGSTDEAGNFVPGTVEIGAQRQRADIGRSMELAGEETTRQAQRQGTLFSGRRATNLARAQHPFVSALADLDVDIPRQLSELYGRATGLVDQYTLGQNTILADAAARAAARIAQTSGAGLGGGGGGVEPGGGGGGGGAEFMPVGGNIAPLLPGGGAPGQVPIIRNPQEDWLAQVIRDPYSMTDEEMMQRLGTPPPSAPRQPAPPPLNTQTGYIVGGQLTNPGAPYRTPTAPKPPKRKQPRY